MKLKNKDLIIALLLSLNIHLSLAIAIQIDWQKTLNKVVVKIKNLQMEVVLESLLQEIKDSLNYSKGEYEKDLAQPKLLDKVEGVLNTSKELVEKTVTKSTEKILDLKEELVETRAESTDPKEGKDSMKYKNPTEPGFGGFLPPPIEVELITQPEPIMSEASVVPEPLKSDEIIMQVVQAPPKRPEDCQGEGKKSFGGVGLSFHPHPQEQGSFLIMNVPEGYPAGKAGLKVGDVIRGDPTRFKGKEETPVEIEYYRSGQRYSVTVIRKQICYKEEKVKKTPEIKL